MSINSLAAVNSAFQGDLAQYIGDGSYLTFNNFEVAGGVQEIKLEHKDLPDTRCKIVTDLNVQARVLNGTFKVSLTNNEWDIYEDGYLDLKISDNLIIKCHYQMNLIEFNKILENANIVFTEAKPVAFQPINQAPLPKEVSKPISQITIGSKIKFIESFAIPNGAKTINLSGQINGIEIDPVDFPTQTDSFDPGQGCFFINKTAKSIILKNEYIIKNVSHIRYTGGEHVSDWYWDIDGKTRRPYNSIRIWKQDYIHFQLDNNVILACSQHYDISSLKSGLCREKIDLEVISSGK